MSSKILAWDSQKQRKNVIKEHGIGARSYFKRPVKEDYWIKVEEHSYDGLNYYKTREDFTYNDLLEFLDIDTVNWLKKNTDSVSEAKCWVMDGAKEHIAERKRFKERENN